MFDQKQKNQLLIRRGESEAFLRQCALCRDDELRERLAFDDQPLEGDLLRGLSAEQAEERLDEYGPNMIVTGQESTFWKRLLSAFINPFNLVLFLVAAVTFVTDVALAKTADYSTTLIIVALVALSSLIAFFQGERSNAAAAKLSHMIINKADVLRDNVLTEVDIDSIVTGDVVKLSAGDMIPADVRFLTTKDTFVAQAALTGESAPVEKFSHPSEKTDEALTDLRNLGFMGSDIISGSAMALVLATGNDTYFGSMAKSLSGDKAASSFERGVDSVSRLLIRFMLVMVPVILLVNGLRNGDWTEALLFAVTMAVGLTPEMLPVIMTSTLARGAVSMSKQKTIVKTLSAIQTFGEMDILCTDKTGTLTEDRIILEKYMDVHGNDDPRILRHAYLNSVFQTGLKNLLDLAIINRAKESGMESLTARYTREDEIPFDFSRRRMSVVLKDDRGKRQLITKGAVEEIMSICQYVEYGGNILPLDEAIRSDAMRVYEQHNRDGLRVIAVAQKNDVADVYTFGTQDESSMVLIGFVGFLDPPKASAGIAITALKNHGVRTVVLTGDSEGVAVKVCGKVGVSTERIMNGRDVEALDDEALADAIETCDLYAKLSPQQKKRLVAAFQKKGHTVGYMGDGINDAPALREADVGISVDSGVDIAKETADIILLKKDLMVLERGVLEGRRTFGNIIKYIKMAASGNLGNMISVMAASLFLPFLPLLPVHILIQNLLCDFSQLGIPFDGVDKEYLQSPRRWDTRSISRFMVTMGPLSSIFDIACFAVLWWAIRANTPALAPLFQAGWFIFGTLSQILVVHMIRTRKIPLLQSRATMPLLLSTVIVGVIATVLVFTNLTPVEFAVLPLSFIPWLALLLAAYFIATQCFKGIYVKYFGEWL